MDYYSISATPWPSLDKLLKYEVMQENNTKLRLAIGANLQKARKTKRYTQEEVAKGAGLTTNYYAMLERGESIASLETLYTIFNVLEVKASEILPEEA